MRFNPLSDEQIDALEDQVLTDGFADCYIKEAAEGEAKSSGNPMITLLVDAKGEHGGSGLIYVYLVLTSKKSAIHRLKSFMRSIGEERQYMTGEIIASLLVGKSFKALIRQKKDSKFFEIVEFIAPAKQETRGAPVNLSYPPAARSNDDDDCPF